MDTTKKVTIKRFIKEKNKTISDTVITETPLRIFTNGKEFATIICTPQDLTELAFGYLYSEGIIERREDISSFSLDNEKGIINVELITPSSPQNERRPKKSITPECSFQIAPENRTGKINSRVVLTPQDVRKLVIKANSSSHLYKKTGGVHSAALCTEKDIILFYEDIGRHNAIDKILGRCLLESIPTRDRIMITSGRVSSAIISKVIKAEIPVLISSSAPTDESIEIARKSGVTLIGFVRGQRFNIYSNEWRVKS